MDTTPSLLALHYAEIALKGRNRPYFLRRLRRNMAAALGGEPVESIDHVESRLLVRLADPGRLEPMIAKLVRVFGVQWLSPAVAVDRRQVDPDLTGLTEVAVALAREAAGDARHFKISTRRSDRTFPLISPEINRLVGAAVQQALQLPVRLQRPDLTIHLLVMQQAVLIFTRKIQAAGGLPAGSAGKVAVLLSGGIDSPVAAWFLMRRGCHPEFVHFYAGRNASEADAAKIRQLVGVLARYYPTPLVLHLVPVYPYELRAIGQVDTRHDMVLFRRFMLRAAARIAGQRSARALVTGDSLGQVASQTLGNLAAIGPDLEMEVFRPLIGLDKQEITQRARAIGTYEISIQPHRDCCSLRSPSPVLDAHPDVLRRLADAMDLEAAVAEAVAGSVQESIGPLT